MSNIQKAHSEISKEFIILMAALMSIVAISIDAMLPALGIIAKDLNVTNPNQAQYIIGFIFAGLAIGQLILGPLSDAYGRKKILYGGLIFYLAGSVICLNSTSIKMILIGRFIQGLGAAGPYISCMSIVRDKYSGRVMAKIMSLVMTIFIMVPVIAPALGQIIVAYASWRDIFLLYIIYASLVTIWIKFRLEETLPAQDRIPYKISNIIKGSKTVLQNRTTLIFTIAIGCIFGILSADLNTIQQIFQNQYKVGNLFALFFGLQALAFGIASFINSKLVERLGMRYLCLCATAAIIILSAIFLVINFIISPPFWMYFLYGTLLLFNVGILFGNLNALAMEPMGHIAGIASSIIGASSSLIGIVLGATIGQFYNNTLTPIILGFLILGIAAFAIIPKHKSMDLFWLRIFEKKLMF